MNQERRDPFMLKLHPLAKRLPDPNTKSAEWLSFIESVRIGGIRENIVITPEGLILHGKARWMAAKALELHEVPVAVRLETEAALVVVESLLHCKHMTRGAAVYLAIGLMPEFVAAANARRLGNLKRGDKTPEIALKVPNVQNERSGDTDETVAELCERWGTNETEFRRAVRVRKLFENPALKAEFEPDLLSGEKSLWNVESAIKGRDPSNQNNREGAKTESQLELFTSCVGDLSTSAKYWNKFPEDKREKLRKDWIKTVKALPQELKDATLEVLEGVAA